MAGTEQVNVRVPPEARELIVRIAQLLRDDSRVAPRLKKFITELDDASVGPLLVERVEMLERRLDRLEIGRVGSRDTQRDAARDVSAPAVIPENDPQVDMFGEPVPRKPVWASGMGKGRRLTPEGEAEVERRIRAGESDSEIASAMDIRPNTVKNRRSKLETSIEEPEAQPKQG